MKRFFVTAAIAFACISQAQAGALFTQSAYAADITLTDGLDSTSMGLAHDGTNYWSASGGSTGGTRLARYDAAGHVTGTYWAGLDFRSVFTNASNDVLARQYNNNTIYKQTAPGTFSTLLTLNGGTLDAQSAVVLNDSGEYVAMQGGNVNVWNAAGAYLRSFELAGDTGSYPDNRGIAAAGDYLLTYANQTLKAWDYTGALVDSATLTGAGSSFDSHFSFSYTNDRFFVLDTAGGTWRGYDVGLVSGTVPEPGALGLALLALGAAALSRRKATAA